MYFLAFIAIPLLVFISDCKGAISDKRLCGDPTCSEPVSLGLTLIRYISDDARILSFQGNVNVKVFSKSAGTRPDLWGVEIDGKRGYAPKSFIKEQKILKGQLEHIISTSDGSANEVSQPPTPSYSIEGSDNGNMARASTAGAEKNVPASEMLEPYEVVDGTTIVFSPDSMTESSPIQATTTTTDSNVLPSTAQFQSDTGSTTKTLENPTPNPSLAVPNAVTSADANGEKQDTEGSAEKIYNYLLSNFLSEEGGDEVTSAEAVGDKEDLDLSGDSNGVEEVILKPTESSPGSSGSIPDYSHTSTPPTSTSVDVTSGTAQTEALKKDDEGNINLSSSDSKASERVNPIVADKTNLDENSDEGSGEDDEDQDDEDDEDVEEEDGDADISGEGKNGMEREAGNNHVETTTDSTHSQIDLRDPAKKEKITKEDNNVNETNSEYIGIKSVEGTEQMTNNFVSDGNVSSGNATPESGESRNEDLVSNLSAQAVDLPSLGMNDPTSAEMTGVKSFYILAQTVTKVDSTTEATVDQHTPHISSNMNVDPIDESTTGDDTKEINSIDKPLDLTQTGSDVKNIGDEITVLSESDNVSYKVNDLEQDQNQMPVSVEPHMESFSNSTAQEPNIPVTEEYDNVAHINNDDFVTKSPTDESTDGLYVDVDEDSPLNVVMETPATLSEGVVDAVADNIAESSVGVFSGLIGSLYSSFFTVSETSSPTESEDASTVENKFDGSAEKTEFLTVIKGFLLNSGKQPINLDALSTCSAQSGNDPNCDSGLLDGSHSSGSDGEAAVLETMEKPIPPVVMENSGFFHNLLDFAGVWITTILMAMILGPGYYFFREIIMRDSTYIKRINDLERALLYAELESQNLKVDLEETRNKVISVEDDNIMKAKLQEALDTATGLEEKNATLQESLDAATEAGLELNRMLSDVLSTNVGSDALMLSVNDLQKELNSQQTTINHMNSVLSLKETESEGLRNNLAAAQETIQSLKGDIKHLIESLQERMEEKQAQEERYKSMKINLANQLKEKSSHVTELVEEVGALQLKMSELENTQRTCDVEMGLLHEAMKQLKESSSIDNEQIEQLFDVAKLKATCLDLQTERDRLFEELQGEKDARKLLADHVEVTTKEVETLWNTMEKNDKEKQEALTKYAVLADYFKDKESQLHKEIGHKDAMYMQSQGEATSTHEEIKTLHEQVESYKSQIGALKNEIIDQERGLKSQILAFEKKAQDNWLAGRQADRQLQEARLEASLLRNRLTIVEKNASNASRNDVSTQDRDPLGLSSVSPPTSQLYPLTSQLSSVEASPRLHLPPPPLAPLSHPLEETQLHNRSNHASPSLGTRLPPVVHKSPANFDVVFRGEEVHDPQNPHYGFTSTTESCDPFYTRFEQDRQRADIYQNYPNAPFVMGTTPVILPPPLPPNILGTRDHRPPPLGRMSSPPGGERMSPSTPRGHKASPLHGRVASPSKHSIPPPPDRRRRRSSPLSDRVQSPLSSSAERSCSPSPERGRRSLKRRNVSPTRRHRSRSLEQERRRSVDSNSQNRASPLSHGCSPSPGQRRSYRRRSRSPSLYSSDGSTTESHRRRRRRRRHFDFSPDSYLGRSRTTTPSSFRPISRNANQGSNHSYESDESNRRGGRP